MSSLGVLVEFFGCALGAGLLLSVTCAFLGVFVILKRVAFVGITLSEVAAAGLAGGFLLIHVIHAHDTHGWLESNTLELYGPLLSAVGATIAAVTVLATCGTVFRIPQDAVSGILFAVAGAASILLVSHSGFGLEEIKELLWGNLLVARRGDLLLALFVLGPVILALLWFRPHLVLAFSDRDLATLVGLRPILWELGFFYGLGLVVAVGSKIGGSLLVFSYLVIPSSTALLACRRIHTALWMAAFTAAGCTLAGLYASVIWDLPASQLVIAFQGVACLLVSLGRFACNTRS